MCDTIFALPNSTARGLTLFGKNSDRQRNEAHVVERIGRERHSLDGHLKCTYLTIPQVEFTHALIVCRPFWTWGAEMGANEHGVAIGNEAVFAKIPGPEQPALTGMDLVRLALERAVSASRAVEVITSLLEQFGQGGNCGHLREAYYHNSFLIADTQEGFVLETVGREWLVERVRDIRAISNAYSIGRNPERVSAGLPQLIARSGWSSEREPDYATVLADATKQHIGSAAARQRCGLALLAADLGHLDVARMTAILRDHGLGPDAHLEWNPECVIRKSLCLHAGDDERSGQTVGSMVSELGNTGSIHWVTATASPCLSIFKPLLIDVQVPLDVRPTDRFNPRAQWWRHERLHRAAVMGDFGRVLEDIRPERDALEAGFRSRMAGLSSGASASDRQTAVTDCWKEAMEMEDRWLTRTTTILERGTTRHHAAWSKLNRIAAMSDDQ